MNSKLDLAFKLMRQQNLIAKQNFACCILCATKQLNVLAKERKNKAIGAVFYTRKEAEIKAKGSTFNIWFGSFRAGNEKIREIIKDSLSKAGISHSYSDDEDDQSFRIHSNLGDQNA